MEKKVFSRSGFVAMALILAWAVLLPAYPADAQQSQTPQYGGTLRNVEGAGARGSFGWPPKSVGNDALHRQPVLECLVREDNAGKIHPWLATAWELAPDRKSITFTLRKGVKFHDGTDFNAEVAKFNLDAQKEAKASGTKDWTSIDIIDDHTVRINLREYKNTLLGFLSGNLGAIVSKAAVEKNGIQWAMVNPVGTGPFKFVSYQRDVVTKFKKNEDYWDKGKPYLDAIELQIIKDPMTQQAAMQAGEIEVLGLNFGKMLADLMAQGFEAITMPGGNATIIPDSANPDSPFADRRVREAVSYAIDREAIAKGKGYGLFQAVYQIGKMGTVAHVPNLEGRRYNPEKAKQLLAEAGYPKGFKTKLIPMPFGIDRDIMVAIQAYLGAVGIQVDLDFVDYGRYSEFRMKGWKDALLCQMIGVFPNFNRTLDWYFSENSPQFPSLKRPEGFQELLLASLATTDIEAEKVQKVVKKVYDEAMLIPIHNSGRGYVVQKYVHNTQHLDWGSWVNWRPDVAWLSKK